MTPGPGIVGRPRTGVRFAFERVEGVEAGATVYRGFAHLPDDDVPIEVRLRDGGGEARVDTTGQTARADGLRPEAQLRALEKVALALVRAGAKNLATAPRKIVRWRP